MYGALHSQNMHVDMALLKFSNLCSNRSLMSTLAMVTSVCSSACICAKTNSVRSCPTDIIPSFMIVPSSFVLPVRVIMLPFGRFCLVILNPKHAPLPLLSATHSCPPHGTFDETRDVNHHTKYNPIMCDQWSCLRRRLLLNVLYLLAFIKKLTVIFARFY